jgi:7,8-dihydropterin-6-yl-methyl-4-(beta-D-ribofuranosyl)aminobenzene 5'-phosphate synthase
MKLNNKLTVVYDNNPLVESLQHDWGFSCLIEYGEDKILFDTGENGHILLSNMATLGIDPRTIDHIVLSHFHHDHTGGLKEFLKLNSKVKVYFPQSFPLPLIDFIKNTPAEPVPVNLFCEILPDIYTLGEIGGTVPEQSLAIRSNKGLVLITGCAHPGIVNILSRVRNSFPKESIYLAIGGFHLHRLSEEDSRAVIRTIHNMGVQTVAPTHCSGHTSRKLFNELFNDNYIKVGLGKTIEIS